MQPKNLKLKLAGLSAPMRICWDSLGIPHVYAASQYDAFAGMGYAAGYERLWQAHLSSLFANGEAASVLGKKFVHQDAVLRTFDVPAARLGVPESSGDWIVDAYLSGINAYVDSLDEVPAEFLHAGTEPRHFTPEDIASRYRFTNWFQHRTWTEKILLAKLMSQHGVERWRQQVRRFSSEDYSIAAELQEAYKAIDPDICRLLYPEMPAVSPVSGSNNWAITGKHSRSGMPMLATDPHQPHSIPNTFFYIHLSAQSWDAFGASFPGMPYFMMGHNRDLAFGLTTGFVDNYDVYVEKVKGENILSASGWQPLEHRTETIRVKDAADVLVSVSRGSHGPLLEPLMQSLGLISAPVSRVAGGESMYQTSVRWNLDQLPSSAGTLARCLLAKDSEEFGAYLFENDVTPLVNNIICVDKHDDLRRWIVATLPKREGVTGMLPLPGWKAEYNFQLSTADEMLVEHNPDCGFTATANNDTMGDTGLFPIHNFPASPARANRIFERLQQSVEEKQLWSAAGFEALQVDYVDTYARQHLPDILQFLQCDEQEDQDGLIARAGTILGSWDIRSNPESSGACVFYSFMHRAWHLDFLKKSLELDGLDASLISVLPLGAPGLNRFSISDLMKPDSPWLAHTALLKSVVQSHMVQTMQNLISELGNNPDDWQWGTLHKIHFWHSLRKFDHWSHMQIGPEAIGGSATTLRMAVHMGEGPAAERGSGESAFRVYHGPAYRLVVDLADPGHPRFVAASGNSGRAESQHIDDHFSTWLAGEMYTLSLDPEELDIQTEWFFE